MILQDSVVVIILMSALLCLPPFLALRLLIRYYRRALRLGTDGVRLLLAAVVVLIGFLFNLGVTYGATFVLSIPLIPLAIAGILDGPLGLRAKRLGKRPGA